MPSRADQRAVGAVLIVALLAVASRLLPHAPNMALLGTLAFVAGRYWPRGSKWLPLGVAIVTDSIIGWYDWPVMVSVWACYALTANLGRLTANVSLRPLSWRPTLSVVLLTVIGSGLFFLVTNTAVWAAGWYPPTVAGWWQSLVNALPFARNTLVSDLSYTVTTIAIVEGMMAAWPSRLVNPRLVPNRQR